MVTLGRKISTSDKIPEFFKVYLPDHSSERMSIPPAFINKFKGIIPKKAVLRDMSGSLWQVELEVIGKDLFIQNGWQGFVRDNSLEHGDFLVFTYSQNSIFDVKLFGKNGCKKEDALTINRTTTMSTHVKEEEDPEANQTDSKPTCVRKQKFSERGLKRIEQSGVAPEVRRYNTRRIAATNTRKHKVFEVARRIAATNVEKRWVVKEPEFVEPKNPYFTAFISRSNRYNVNIPRSVVKKYNIKIHPDMKLRDQSGKLWPVSVVFRGDGRIAITTGWINFRKEMNLGLQDKCVFEFVLRGRISKEMRVQIFRKKTRSQRYSSCGTRG